MTCQGTFVGHGSDGRMGNAGLCGVKDGLSTRSHSGPFGTQQHNLCYCLGVMTEKAP